MKRLLVKARCSALVELSRQADVQLIAAYAELWLASRTRYQPIRLDGATLQAEIGYDWSARHATPGARSTQYPKSLILRGFGSTNVLARVANPVPKHRRMGDLRVLAWHCPSLILVSPPR